IENRLQRPQRGLGKAVGASDESGETRQEGKRKRAGPKDNVFPPKRDEVEGKKEQEEDVKRELDSRARPYPKGERFPIDIGLAQKPQETNNKKNACR
ncbi:MAG: hypothetical protein AABZ59_07075, partial [Candidatus Binatota bacterium]